MKQRTFDVVVVGGGHAGTEAVLAAHRLGAKAVLVTHRFDRLGEMSCNPAIGGLGKGHLVREIDALDGLMGRAADLAGIQFRLLNRTRGPAAQGPRTQADRSLYRAAVQNHFQTTEGLLVIEDEVTDLIVIGGIVAGVVLGDGSQIDARSVILTTGTFLGGMIHRGNQTEPAGRVGDPASIRLADRLRDLALPLGRLKTGTPPRLDGRTINWEAVGMQAGDEDPVMLSFLSHQPAARQISCGITFTSERGHELIRANIARSALFGGQISGVGPRYCPSIEDKVIRFSEKTAHQIFLEPEGLRDHTIYPNGISTSLPSDVQEEFVQTIQGLEEVKITQPGYAIEYDYIDPRSLDVRLGVKALPGLFLAGQINGTTGYEEAAGQGLVVGLNAALHARSEAPFILNRSQAYLGVLIDDLITKGVSEPYRMFTSRAEYRLQLRADNADQRLTEIGRKTGCVGDARWEKYTHKINALCSAKADLESISVSPTTAAKLGISVNQDGLRRSLLDLLSLPEVDFSTLSAAFPSLGALDIETIKQLSREALYAPYLSRQAGDVERLRRDESVVLPEDLDYRTMSGLSNEIRAKLVQIQPRTVAQASRIEGMTPAALTLLLIRAQQFRATRTAS